MGVYKEVKDTKNSFSHYAVPLSQFSQLNDYIVNLENEIIVLNDNIKSLNDKHTVNLDTVKKDCNHKLKELESTYNKQILDLKTTIEEYTQELKKLNSLNNNLLRISKERANQERNLRPKKAHSGFVILNRQSLYYKLYSNVKSNYKSNQVNYIEFTCFKIKIQTPFHSSISFDLIEDEMKSSFSKFIKDLGIGIWYKYDYIISQPISKIKDIIFNNEYDNFIFKYSYTANFKSNLWDIEIYTKKDLTI